MNKAIRTCLAALLIGAGFLYAAWLLYFTLSNGFTTLGSDSANYVLLARKWSPYFMPSEAVSGTWPMQTFPVAFPLLLAFTGVSNSFLLSHLVVSVLLLLSLVLIFVLLQQKFGTATGFLTTLTLGLLPGMFINSMGILSENYYLFLSVFSIALISHSFTKESCRSITLILISILLLLLINTRSIGIAIIPAIAVIILFDRSIAPQIMRGFTIAIVVVTLIWIAWKFAYSIEGATSYFNLVKPSLLKSLFGYDNEQADLKQIMLINLKQLPYAWNQYFSLSFGLSYFPIFLLAILCLTQICAVIRAVERKLDALYICFYFLILIFWPFPVDDRFLHPIVALLLLQPLFLAGEIDRHAIRKPLLVIYSLSMVLILLNALFAQSVLLERKLWTRDHNPQIGNYRDFYRQPDTGKAIENAEFIGKMIQQAQYLKTVLPESAVVSANKPVFIALLTDRTTVPLKMDITVEQQLCNLQLKGVDYVLFSQLITDYTMGGLDAESEYQDFIQERNVIREGEEHVATLVRLDKEALVNKIVDSDFHCESYKLFSDH